MELNEDDANEVKLIVDMYMNELIKFAVRIRTEEVNKMTEKVIEDVRSISGCRREYSEEAKASLTAKVKRLVDEFGTTGCEKEKADHGRLVYCVQSKIKAALKGGVRDLFKGAGCRNAWLPFANYNCGICEYL